MTMSNRETDRAMLSTPISELGLSRRGENALKQAGIQTLQDVLEWTERELRTLRNCGPVTVSRLKSLIETAGHGFASIDLDARASGQDLSSARTQIGYQAYAAPHIPRQSPTLANRT